MQIRYNLLQAFCHPLKWGGEANEDVQDYDSNHKDKWYAVIAETKVSVFKTWYMSAFHRPSAMLQLTWRMVYREEASGYVLNVSGSRYKSHRSHAATKQYYEALKTARDVRIAEM